MIIALVNSKGGVGKSTLAGNLVGWLHEHGKSVILADADTQQSSTDLDPQSITLRQAYADAPGQAAFVWRMGYQARDAAEEIDGLFSALLPDAVSDKVVALRKGKGTANS